MMSFERRPLTEATYLGQSYLLYLLGGSIEFCVLTDSNAVSALTLMKK